jgi:hypothetical protein
MASPELNVNLLSKSSPSQLPAFQFKRSRTQPIPTEAFYSSQQQQQQQQQQQKAGSKRRT